MTNAEKVVLRYPIKPKQCNHQFFEIKDYVVCLHEVLELGLKVAEQKFVRAAECGSKSEPFLAVRVIVKCLT